MGEGVSVPIEKLTSTANVVAALGKSAKDIADGLSDADPPDVLWGALGLLVKGQYDEKANEARDHIKKIAEALDSQSGAIRGTVDRYCELDEALTQAFNRVLEKLNGTGGGSGTPSGGGGTS